MTDDAAVELVWQWLLSRARGGLAEPPPRPEGVEAEQLLELFEPVVRRTPFVIAQLGQSLDGRIATHTGHSHYINGPEDLRRLHRLRALVDAVVVGAGTVVADDPQLTVRRVEGPNPVRVVLDARGRLATSHRVFADGAAPTLWLRSTAGEGHGRGHGQSQGERQAPASGRAEVVLLDEGVGGGFDPADIVRVLRSRGLGRILVEGGGRTVSGFVAAGVVDRLHLSVAPLLIGSGRPGLTLPRIDRLDDAMRPPARHFRLGRDLLFDLDLTGDSSD